MIRLLLATYAYPPSVGGVERHSRALARQLVARGHQVRVITAQVEGAPAREVDDGVEITRVSRGTGSRWAQMATYLQGMLRETIAARSAIDIVHVQQALYPAAAMAVVARALRKPLVVRNSGSGKHGAVELMRRLPFGQLGLGLIRHSSTAVSLSQEMTAEMRDAGFREIVEIPNGVTVPLAPIQRAEARRRLGLPDDARVALYVGRLDTEKGTALLARAWHEVKTPDALLLVVGDGPQRDLLEGKNVRKVGFVADTADYFAAADVFVLPSESEGISNALLEAMAAGRAVIATAVGGNREVISSESVGVLVSSGDHGALARAISRLLGDRDLATRLGEAARDHVLRGWSFDAMVDRYEQLYSRLIAR